MGDMGDRPRGRIKLLPEDFVVEEIPAYPPSGAGEHVFVNLTKRDMTTLDAVRAVAEACGCDPRGAGFAGMKDKRAVATQTISLHAPPGVAPAEIATRARALSLNGVVVNDATAHGNKLKPGHSMGNRFTITVRDMARERASEAASALRAVAQGGVPNAFGAQRFGAAGDNAARARAWLRGDERGPRDARVKRLLWSALQSEVFNAVLDARSADATWATPLEGDLLKLRSSGGLFVCTAVQTDGDRAERGELSPTGPIVGARMRWPEGKPGRLEREITDACLGSGFDLKRTQNLGEGSRRALRMWVEDLRWEIFDDGPPGQEHAAVGMRVYFVLPKGGYATTVLAAAVTVDETGGPNVASLPPQDHERQD
jgi:tRNA pseudouridine13 synthase